MKTRVTELLGIEAPIIQGGMARVADASLAAAVSEAGGLGIIACGGAKLDWIAEQVKQAKAQTDKPFGCNIMLMDPLTPEIAKLVVELDVKVVTTGAGSPTEYLPMWREAGIKVIPVIAAGGIADGRGICAAFALGAEGVQMGTRFLTIDECTVCDPWKEKVLGAKDSDTIVTGRGTGHPVRGLKNKFARACRKREMEASSPDDLEGMYAGSLKRAVEGDMENGSILAGQVAALVKKRGTAKELIAELMAEAEALGALDLAAMAELNARQGRCLEDADA